MSGRYRSSAASPSNASRRLGAMGIAGITGFATVFAAAGGAHAAPAPHAPGRHVPAGAPSDASAPTPGTSATPETRKAPMQGDFGTGKIRVGVKIKTGAYVPDGTTTVGSEITIVETGDGVDGGTKTTTCTTDPSTVVPASTASYCIWDNTFSQTDDYYLTEPGDSVSITQTTVNQNLVIDSSVKTFGPCDGTDETGFCDPVTALFVDPGLPPNAVDDFAKTKANVSVTIDVLHNDQPGEPGAPLTITNSTDPKHGTATLSAPPGRGSGKAAPATQTFEYDPDHDFTGVDHFHYTIQTPNGRSTALVTVTVTAPPPVARNNHAQTEQGKSVVIDVENNDSARYPHTKITLVSVGKPEHGTARIHGNTIIYTPVDGFSGTDKFPYKISTPFGTDTAEVTVVIPAAPTTSPPPSGPIAVTGTDVSTDLGVAIGLLIAGGALATVGRRRRRSGGHA